MTPTTPCSRYVALDFETADSRRDSACALGVVVVEDGKIVQRDYQLLRPPRTKFNPFCVRVHGLTWSDVKDAPTFEDYWPRLIMLLNKARFLVAHNAPFDRSVLNECCTAADLTPPALPFLCTVQLARNTWDLESNKLPKVCDHLNIELTHHHAASDAEACARIAIAGLDENPTFLERIL